MPETPSLDPYAVSSFEAFWPHYVRLHQRPETHRWHAVATCSSLLFIGLGLALENPFLLVLGPLADFSIAQSSHRRFEKNRTLPWKNLLWHTRAELRMFRLVFTGRMQAEVLRWTETPGARAENCT